MAEPSKDEGEKELIWEQMVSEYNPNTNAEIVAYLYQHRNLIPHEFPLESLKRIAIDKILTFENKIGMHEFFCYTKLCDAVGDRIKSRLHDSQSKCRW
jgi:hypothetical protein